MERRQFDLVLILAREFADKLATPMLLSDAEGRLVYYNEPAGAVLGRPFSSVGELDAADWSSRFSAETVEGEAMPLERMPAGIALAERRPAHGSLVIVGLDGVRRHISVTAFPLLSRPDEVVGVVAIFWQLSADGA